MARKVFTGAGTGSATITAVYTIGGVQKTATKSITVNKADGGVTISDAQALYGSGNALANVSNATGTVHYRVGTSGTWSTTIPKTSGRNAGTYTLQYYVDASDNYNAYGSSSSPKSLTVTVLPTEMDYGKPGFVSGTITYNGTPGTPATPQKLVNAGATSSSATMYYYVIKATSKPAAPTFNESTWSTATDSTSFLYRTDAGKYFYWYYVKCTSTNYVSTANKPLNEVAEVPSSSENSKTISKATGGVTITNANVKYGSNNALATVSGATGTMYYRLGTSGSFVTTMPTATTSVNVGTYTLYYYVAASDNYNAFGTSSSPNSLTVTIQKANNQIVVSPDNWEGYNRAGYMDIQLTVTNNKGTVTYSSSNTNIATVNSTGYVSGKTIGECDITVTDPGNSNYNSSTAVAHITILQDYIQSTQYKDSACTIQGINTVYNIPSGSFNGTFTAGGGSKTVNCLVLNNTNWYQKWDSGYVEQKTSTVQGMAVWKITSNGNNRFYESGATYSLSGIGQTRESGGTVEHRDMKDNEGRDTVVVTVYNTGDTSKTLTISAFVDNGRKSLVLRIDDYYIDYYDTTFGEVYLDYYSGYVKLIPSELVNFTTNPTGIARITTGTYPDLVMEVDDFDASTPIDCIESYEREYITDPTNDNERHAYEYVEPVKYNGHTYYLWRFCSNNHDERALQYKSYILTDTNNIDTLYGYSTVSNEANIYTHPFVVILNKDLEPYGDADRCCIYNAWEN